MTDQERLLREKHEYFMTRVELLKEKVGSFAAPIAVIVVAILLIAVVYWMIHWPEREYPPEYYQERIIAVKLKNELKMLEAEIDKKTK